ncbi:MAG TPA: DUF488 domain-containing protein [Candidatus Hydrogenedentes bacterium]|nr:DUF488 domain-containing protein [Candidatus Hydrogenedentota bacterium]
MTIFTIGFTKKSAQDFFSRLQNANVKRVLDVRLNNTSQLAGFAKAKDLKYFLRSICEIEYIHLPELAPTQEMLDDYKNSRISWAEYEHQFNTLIDSRDVAQSISKGLLDAGCLLCSEDAPDHCHRRLAAEYFGKHWPGARIVHL